MAWKPSSRDRQFFAKYGRYQLPVHPDKMHPSAFGQKGKRQTEEQFQEWVTQQKARLLEQYNAIESANNEIFEKKKTEHAEKEKYNSPAEVARRAKAAEDKKAADDKAALEAKQRADREANKKRRAEYAAEAKIRAAAKAEEKRLKDESRQKALANQTPEQKAARAKAEEREALFKKQRAARDAVAQKEKDAKQAAYDKTPAGMKEASEKRAALKKSVYNRIRDENRASFSQRRLSHSEIQEKANEEYLSDPKVIAYNEEEARKSELGRRAFELRKRHDLSGHAWDEETGKWDMEAGGDEEMRKARVMVYGADGKLFLPKDQKERDEVKAHWDKVLADAPELNKAWRAESQSQWDASKEKHRAEFERLFNSQTQYLDKNREGDAPPNALGTYTLHSSEPEKWAKYGKTPPKGGYYKDRFTLTARERTARDAINDETVSSNRLKDMLRADQEDVWKNQQGGWIGQSVDPKKFTEADLNEKGADWFAEKIEHMVMNAMIEESKSQPQGNRTIGDQTPQLIPIDKLMLL